MKTIGLDPATGITGWSLIDDSELIDYGTIVLPTGLDMVEKLIAYENELQTLFNRYKPDNVGLEDVVFVNNVQTSKLLARFNTVALIAGYQGSGRTIPFLFPPSEWKSQCGLPGSAIKSQVQMFVGLKFGKMTQAEYDEFNLEVEKILEERKRCSNVKRKITARSKKREIEAAEKKQLEKEIGKEKRANDNREVELSKQIYLKIGIDENTADSIAIALAAEIRKNA